VPLLPKTGSNTVSNSDAATVWATLCGKMQSLKLGNLTVPNATRFTDSGGPGDQIIAGPITVDPNSSSTVTVKVYRYDSNSLLLKCLSTGTTHGITRKIETDFSLAKEAKVLQYSIASRARVWITANSTVHGDIYSSWQWQNESPFNLTADSSVLGTINVVLTQAQMANMPYKLDATDQIQGYCQGVNYGEPDSSNIPGMTLSDYDTSSYKSQTAVPANITADSAIYNYNHDRFGNPTTLATTTEYFPSEAGNYSQPSSSGSLRLNRAVAQNKTLTNLRIPANKNAVFKDCTFNGILYVDCGTSGTGNYNNVRFEDCTFNGPIVTNGLNYSSSDINTWWMKNCLYFTGTETFTNNTTVPATILAPNFNVNLGNTNPVQSDDNILTGAIVGGIVDVRGNAQITGTIISMFDTRNYPTGYVSNIGATTADGGSETTEPGDFGVININPPKTNLLPSGITTPITITPIQSTYAEVF
jgi:hypothetical protein